MEEFEIQKCEIVGPPQGVVKYLSFLQGTVQSPAGLWTADIY